MLLNDIVVLPEGGDFLTAISAGNGTLHERSEVVKDFTPECGGINRGDTPRVPKAPRGVPEVDPDTRGE